MLFSDRNMSQPLSGSCRLRTPFAPTVGFESASADRALADRAFRQVTKAAEVKRVKFHALRHTCATLLLSAGVPVQVIAQRLGHAQISMTLEVYSHALPDMHRMRR